MLIKNKKISGQILLGFFIFFLFLIFSFPSYAADNNNNDSNFFDKIIDFLRVVFTSKTDNILKPLFANQNYNVVGECDFCSCNNLECHLFCPKCQRGGGGWGAPQVTNCVWFFGEDYGAEFEDDSYCNSDLQSAVNAGYVGINNDFKNPPFTNSYLCGLQSKWCLVLRNSPAYGHTGGFEGQTCQGDPKECYRYCGDGICQLGEESGCPLNDCEGQPDECEGTPISCGLDYSNCEDCTLRDCTASDGFTCQYYYQGDFSRIHEIGSDYTCVSNEEGCSDYTVRHCNPPSNPPYWTCNPTYQCITRACGDNLPDQFKCFKDSVSGLWKWGGSPGNVLGVNIPSEETNCEDNYDNDCDGLFDGDDPDCGTPPENEICNVVGDEDGDGYADCLDPDCYGYAGPNNQWCCSVVGDCVGDDDYDEMCNTPTCSAHICTYPQIPDNQQDLIGNQKCDDLCQACQAGSCGNANSGSDPGDDCLTDVCANGFCDGLGACQIELPSTQCREANGDCDVAEYCDGNNIGCPVDGFKLNSFECRISGGICDVAEFCTGTGPNCPADQKRLPTFQCRSTNGICDVAEFCDGLNVNCPVDGFKSVGALCANIFLCSNTGGGNNAYNVPDYKLPSKGFCDGTVNGCDWASIGVDSCNLAENAPPQQGSEGSSLSICVDTRAICVDTCSDGISNDGDACIDGVDVDCGGSESSCSNSVDDDCDGLTDGNDPDCFVCTPGHSQPCGNGVCVGTQTCLVSGLWGECSMKGQDCGTCCICENNNNPNSLYDETQDSDCPIYDCDPLDTSCTNYDDVRYCKGINDCADANSDCNIFNYLGTNVICANTYLCSNSGGGNNAYNVLDYKLSSKGFCDGSGGCDWAITGVGSCNLAEGTIGQEGSSLSICVDNQVDCVETCNDNYDNDGDGCEDEIDADCGGSESSCYNSVDDDCDGLMDCEDTDCIDNPVCDCVEPYSGMLITEDTVLCPGYYGFPGWGIRIMGDEPVTLECLDTFIEGWVGIGVVGIEVYESVPEVTIRGCEMTVFEQYIRIYGSTKVTIENNILGGYGLHGIYFDNAPGWNSVISDNQIYGVGLSGVYVNGNLDSTNLLLRDNEITGNGYGVEIENVNSPIGVDGGSVCGNGIDAKCVNSLGLLGENYRLESLDGCNVVGNEPCQGAAGGGFFTKILDFIRAVFGG